MDMILQMLVIYTKLDIAHKVQKIILFKCGLFKIDSLDKMVNGEFQELQFQSLAQ